MKCANSEAGWYNQECGKPAMWIGTHASGHRQAFCLACRAEGREARGVKKWEPCEPLQSPGDAFLEYQAMRQRNRDAFRALIQQASTEEGF